MSRHSTVAIRSTLRVDEIGETAEVGAAIGDGHRRPARRGGERGVDGERGGRVVAGRHVGELARPVERRAVLEGVLRPDSAATDVVVDGHLDAVDVDSVVFHRSGGLSWSGLVTRPDARERELGAIGGAGTALAA